MINDPHQSNIRAAVVLFNMGGPSSLDSVEDFLFNLFFDKRIIPLRTIPRFLLAKFISKRRKHKAIEIYKQLGGKSPIEENTIDQATKLQNYLIKNHNIINNIQVNWRVMYAMRYSRPRIEKILPMIDDFNPQYLVLLPLYPQYSTTTTESFFDDFRKFLPDYKSASKIIPVYDYHNNPLYITACANVIRNYIIENNIDIARYRLLFSAHGLPESIIKAGDQYQKQTEESARLILENLSKDIGNIDSMLCYQSKVGGQKWLSPSLNDAIIKAKKDEKNILIFPISFTSEHSETLVELDIEAKEFANSQGIKSYHRIQTLSSNQDYIDCLAKISCEKIQEKI